MKLNFDDYAGILFLLSLPLTYPLAAFLIFQEKYPLRGRKKCQVQHENIPNCGLYTPRSVKKVYR